MSERGLSEHVKAALLAVAVGVLAGNACAAFLVSLSYVTELRLDDPRWVYACPVLGLAVGLLVRFGARGKDVSVNAVIEGVHDPSRPVPAGSGAVLFAGALLTHLGGGSAGREGVGVLLGGVCASIVARVSRLGAEATRILLLAGLSAGFAATFGTPLAAMVFALEVVAFGRISYDGLLAVFAAALAGSLTTNLWPMQHAVFPIGDVPVLTASLACQGLFAGLVFGFAGLLFLWLLRGATRLARWAVPIDWARPAVGGAVIAGSYAITGSQTYLGLGLATIEEAFNTPLDASVGALKALATAFTLGFGLKGGEVTPLFFVGASLGNALEATVGLPFPLLAGMGLVAVLTGVTNTPLAGILLGMELFGAQAGVYCALACVGSYLIVGHRGLYASQRVGVAKAAGLRGQEGRSISTLGEL